MANNAIFLTTPPGTAVVNIVHQNITYNTNNVATMPTLNGPSLNGAVKS